MKSNVILQNYEQDDIIDEDKELDEAIIAVQKQQQELDKKLHALRLIVIKG